MEEPSSAETSKPGKICTITEDMRRMSLTFGKPRQYIHGDNFYQFCERFKEYVSINSLDKHLDLIFLSLVDNRTHATLKNVSLNDEEKKCSTKLCKAFKDAINPNVGNAAILAKLYTIKQNNRESIDDYTYRLGNITQKLAMKDDDLSNHKLEAFIKGLENSAIKIELAKDKKNLEYESAVTAAKTLEVFFNENDNQADYASNIQQISYRNSRPNTRSGHNSRNSMGGRSITPYRRPRSNYVSYLDRNRKFSRDRSESRSKSRERRHHQNDRNGRSYSKSNFFRDRRGEHTHPSSRRNSRGRDPYDNRGESSHCTICNRYGHSAKTCYSNEKGVRFSCKICGRQNHNESSCFYRNRSGRKCNFCNKSNHSTQECWSKHKVRSISGHYDHSYYSDSSQED